MRLIDLSTGKLAPSQLLPGLRDEAQFNQPGSTPYQLVTGQASSWAMLVPYGLLNGDLSVGVIDLATGEQKHFDADYMGFGPIALNADATRLALQPNTGGSGDTTDWIDLWNPHTGGYVARVDAKENVSQLHFSSVQRAVILVPDDTPSYQDFVSHRMHFDQDTGVLRFPLHSSPGTAILDVAESPAGRYFAVASEDGVYLFRGSRSADLAAIVAIQAGSVVNAGIPRQKASAPREMPSRPNSSLMESIERRALVEVH
jgi:hypothetical protein